MKWMSISLLLLCTHAHSEGAIVIGGHVSDDTEWVGGYSATAFSIDGISVENPTIHQFEQKVYIVPGEHRLGIECGFFVQKGINLGGEKQVTMTFEAGKTYRLSATVNYSKGREISPIYRYCEPNIELFQ